MKTKEELNALKEEVETVSRKLRELTEEDIAQVFGGADGDAPSIIQPSPSSSDSTKKCPVDPTANADVQP